VPMTGTFSNGLFLERPSIENGNLLRSMPTQHDAQHRHPVFPELHERDMVLGDYEAFHLENDLHGNDDRTWIPAAVETEADLWKGAAVTGVSLAERATQRVLALANWGFLTPETSAEVLACDGYANEVFRSRLRRGLAVTHPDLDKDPGPFAREAANGGVHLHLFHFDYAGSPEGIDSLRSRAMLAEAWASRVIGAHIRLISVQAIGKSYVDQLDAAHFRTFTRSVLDGKAVALMGCTVDDAVAPSNAMLIRLLSSCPPRIPLSHKQRSILYYFNRGLTDPEIASKVFLAANSMKTSWDRIFQAFAAQDPAFDGEREKRKALRSYLHLHPEEMWPFGS